MSLTAQPQQHIGTTRLQGTFYQLLARGLVAGLLAGLLAGAVAFLAGEQHIEAAIAIEQAEQSSTRHDAAVAAETEADNPQHESAQHSHEEGEALVSRDGQRIGLFLATALGGGALGALYAAFISVARTRSQLSGVTLSLITAGCGWLAIEAVPFLKYPANPPAVGDPETIDQRTLLWLAAVVVGFAAVAAAAVAYRRLGSSGMDSVRAAGAAAVFAIIVAAGYLLLPAVNEVGSDFPASLLWDFRISSALTQATLWLALGVIFAGLSEYATRSPVQRLRRT
ncbi:hypothetical protein CBI38_31890 (plasmid) [Rhodococcus oxybenzonivorans]|jgi:predicted cobalt transporter CbtA|uniref:Cobalt transporter CbtA n=1 Tax=Rhodococcus oxybenzonivorans TaxID=1990687 RepID=A0A2S2C5I0_9NOCA|nr:CbtA family protein [Rhodococcus oxybenzonivorans]AWK76125.1 hypothetical protein CBI38_31890 [Rhodococcus oxybenzonivorans]